MSKNSIKFGNIVIKYGYTPVQELLNIGYSVSDLIQITEEPVVATCNLNKNGETVAILSFYGLKEKITIDQLRDIPIDLIFFNNIGKRSGIKGLSYNQACKNRIVWTCLIHFFAAGIFFCIYAIPFLFTWVQKAEFRARGGRMPVGMVLLILPAILITFIWGGVESKRNDTSRKILLSFWLIFNVIISITYLVLIDIFFTHRYF